MARLSIATRYEEVIQHHQGLSLTRITKQTGLSRCAVQALLKKHKKMAMQPRKHPKETHDAYFPSKSEDFWQYHQVRSSRNQWSLWEVCGRKLKLLIFCLHTCGGLVPILTKPLFLLIYEPGFCI